MSCWSDGDTLNQARLRRLSESIPLDYMIYNDTSTFRAESCLTSKQNYSDSDFVTLLESYVLPALTSGGVVGVKGPGTFNMTSTLNLTTTNTSLLGIGYPKLFNYGTENRNMIIIGDGTNQPYDITVKGFEIDGNRTNKTADLPNMYQGMIHVKKSTDVDIEDNYIHSAKGNAITLYGAADLDVQRTFIHGNYMSDSVQDALCDDGIQGERISYCVIDQNTFMDNDDNAVSLFGGSHHNTISHNAISSPTRGKWQIVLSGESTGGPNVHGSWANVVDGNTIFCQDVGIYLYGEETTHNTISNNTVYGVTSGALLDGILLTGDGAQGYPTYNTIMGNALNGSDTVASIGINEEAGCNYNIIVGNIVHNFPTTITCTGANSINQHNVEVV